MVTYCKVKSNFRVATTSFYFVFIAENTSCTLGLLGWKSNVLPGTRGQEIHYPLFVQAKRLSKRKSNGGRSPGHGWNMEGDVTQSQNAQKWKNIFTGNEDPLFL